MKAIYKNIALAALALSAVACTQEEDFAPSYLNDPDAVRITAQVATGNVTGGFTRSNPLGTAEQQAKFNNGDKVAVTAGTQTAVTYTFNGIDTWTPEEGKYLKWVDNSMTFNAWYPVTQGTDATTFTVPISYADVDAMAAADYMVYTGTQNKTSGNGVTLPMERKMARIVITPILNDEFPETNYSITGIKVHANTSGYANGTVKIGSIEVTALEQGDAYYALLAPTTSADDATFLTVTVTKTDDSTSQELTVKGIPATEAGQSYDYTLTVGKAEATIGNVKVNPWTDGTINGGKAEEVPVINYVWTRGIEASASESVEGEGTEASPYLIHSASDLQWMIDQVNTNGVTGKYFQLTHNLKIDSEEGATWTPIGTSSSPFVGYFDGGGHTISGEMVTASDVVDAGFFGYVGVGTVITNLTNAADITPLVQGACKVGGIVGFAIGYDEYGYQYNSTYIIACHNTGTITYTNSGTLDTFICLGGIAGYIHGGTCVLACSNTGGMVNNSSLSIIHGGIVGVGETGINKEPSVVSCWTSKGTIIGDNVDVITRANYSTDSNCSDEEFYTESFTDELLNEVLNSWINGFNVMNYDYTYGMEFEERDINCDWYWELENGSVVLRAVEPI